MSRHGLCAVACGVSSWSHTLRSGSALQRAKAEAAAEIAEAKQRARDSMKDLQERLGNFGGFA